MILLLFVTTSLPFRITSQLLPFQLHFATAFYLSIFPYTSPCPNLYVPSLLRLLRFASLCHWLPSSLLPFITDFLFPPFPFTCFPTPLLPSLCFPSFQLLIASAFFNHCFRSHLLSITFISLHYCFPLLLFPLP
jgi:hypothetical protein